MKNRFYLLFMLVSTFAYGEGAFVRNLSLRSPRMSGSDVQVVQTRLLELGYEQVGEADGWFGPMSEAGVKSFQEDYFIEADGIISKELYFFLFSENCGKLKAALEETAVMDAEDSYEMLSYEAYYEAEGYPLGIETELFRRNGRIVKADMRLFADGSGYEYAVYFIEGEEIVRIDSVWWYYDFESETIGRYEPVRYFLGNGSCWAVKYPGENWDFEISEDVRSEVQMTIGPIGVALEQNSFK